MTHPADTCYHVVLAAGLQAALDSISGQPFGVQNKTDQSGVYAIIDCQSENSISSYSELISSIIGSPPSWITDVTGANPENCIHANAALLKATQGASGAAWGPAQE